MTEKKFAVVTTTIRVPTFLRDYALDFARSGFHNVEFIVIADLATPSQAEAFANSLNGGFRVDYWSVARQREWLKTFPELDRSIPYNSVQRRNLGYLIAARNGADVIVSIDDDNFLDQPNYLAHHAQVGEVREIACVRSDSGWFNVCSLLATDPPRKFYHRGFPVSKRWRDSQAAFETRRGRIAVNAGLWLGDPDVNAAERMSEPFRITAYRGPAPHVGLAKNTWSPFNSQNTAFIRDLLPFLFLITVPGSEIGGYRARASDFRYDDIWMSYFAKLAIDKMGDIVTFGEPIVRHERNAHDLLSDLDRELVPMFLTEVLTQVLSEIKLESTTYVGLHAELVKKLREALRRDSRIGDREQAYFKQVFDGMTAWRQACAEIIEAGGRDAG
jgi:hypothetical protein